AWFAASLVAVYLTTSEWMHVQPDTWMLLPALVALHLRRRRLAVLTSATSLPPAGWSAVPEGAFWAAACLFKPFAFVPACACWLASAVLLRHQFRRWGPPARDAAGLLFGGLLAGVAWQGWLLWSGSWSHYWHNFFDYRGDYYASSAGWT